MDKIDIINNLIEETKTKILDDNSSFNFFKFWGDFFDYMLPWVCSFTLGIIPIIIIHYNIQKNSLLYNGEIETFCNRGELLWLIVSLCGVTIGDALRATQTLTLNITKYIIIFLFIIGVFCSIGYILTFYTDYKFWKYNVAFMIIIFSFTIIIAGIYARTIQQK